MRLLFLCLGLVLSPALLAEEALLRPYVLASDTPGAQVERVADDLRRRLAGSGYEIVGSYAPFPDTQVVAITSRALKAAATPSLSGFGAVVHVGITRVGDHVQTSYLNPRYLAAAYRETATLDDVAADLARVLGQVDAFGADPGLTRQKLLGYRYLPGMESFSDTYDLARYGSQAEAVIAVERNLAARAGGAAKVYRLDLGGDRTLFGISRAAADDGRLLERHELAEVVDAQAERKTTPYLPYQLLVENGQVRALHMRFRMAVWHPDLSMLTFGKLMSSPAALGSLLKQVAASAP